MTSSGVFTFALTRAMGIVAGVAFLLSAACTSSHPLTDLDDTTRDEVLQETQRASELASRGNYRTAESSYGRALELLGPSDILTPPDSDDEFGSMKCACYTGRAICRLALGDAAGANVDATSAIETDPESPSPYAVRIHALQRLGEHQSARAEGERFLARFPNHSMTPEVRKAMASTDALGQLQELASQLEQLGNAESIEELESLLESMKQGQK